MSQKQRIEQPGASYYLQLRDNNHRELFAGHADCRHLRQLLGSLYEASGGQVLGYCLLQDSIHLVLMTPDDGCMSCVQMGQWLMTAYNQYYNQYYNEVHGLSGSLFHDHFPTVLIDPNQFLLAVIHKLHRLPVSQGLVPQPAAYPWSSHWDYLSPEPPSWLNRNEVLRRVTSHHAMQVRRYESLMEENVLEDVDWISGNHPVYRALTSNAYIEKLINTRERQHDLPQVDLAALVRWVCAEYGLTERDLTLWRRHRLVHEVRAVVAALAVRVDCASAPQVAAFFDCTEDLLDTGIRAVESQRSMYLYRLQLKLEKEINTELDQDTPAIETVIPQPNHPPPTQATA